MILGMGTDVAEVRRIRRSLETYGDRFVNRIYTQAERSYALSKGNAAERLAVRFAAKEAGMKAIGTGWQDGVGWHDFEVVNEDSGKPVLRLHGEARRLAEKMGVSKQWVTLTHTAEVAFAVVILEG